MASVYFDTDVFIALFGGQEGPAIKGLLRELKRDKVRVYTSILTVQEVSVLSFMRGSMVTDNHVKVAKLARIVGITKEIALTAAKFEAAVKEAAKLSGASATDIEQNRRRKWDCFHLATAVALTCRAFYAFDTQYSAKRKQLNLGGVLAVMRPAPSKPSLLDPQIIGTPPNRTV